MSWILVLFVVVQILFHSSLSALVVGASRSWCGTGILDSFVQSVLASLGKKSASFYSLVWRDLGDYYLFIVVGKFRICFLNNLYDFVFFGGITVDYLFSWMYRSASSIAYVSAVRMNVWLGSRCVLASSVTIANPIPCLVLEA